MDERSHGATGKGRASRPVRERRRRRLGLLGDVERHVPIRFSLVGVQKAATSTLYRLLTRHPRIVGGPEKEMRYFMDERRDWSTEDHRDYVRPAVTEEADVAGDATPAYFFWPRALERMHDVNPSMQLMVSLRDPIERAMSQWSMQRERDPEFPDVPDAIAAYASDHLPDRVPAGMSVHELRRQSLFTRGLYGQQLRRGLALFPREQWLVLDFREITSRPTETLDRVTDFLGIERFREHPEPLHRNSTRTDHSGAAPTAADIETLVALYEPELAELQQLSGLDVSGWSTSRVLAGELDLEEFTATISAKLGLAR